MKINILILCILALATYFLTLHFSQKTAPDINQVPDKTAINKTVDTSQKIPDFSFTDIKGTPYKAHDFKNKIIILNFWASWCAPCIKEFPNLLNATQNHQDDVILIALSSDLEESAIHKFIKKMEANPDISFDTSNILIALDNNQEITSKLFQTFKLPETFIIDQNLKIRHKLIGADWESEDLENIIKELKK